MNTTQAIKMAAKSISSNKGRSALTMLGVIIGLAAVIILVSYAQGQNAAMNAYYESMGNNKINISASTWGGSADVSQSLYDYCMQLDDLVLGITPNGRVWDDITIKYGAKTLAPQSWGMMGSTGGSADYPQLLLGNDQYGLCNGYTVANGRDLSYLDIQKDNQVCVLGGATAEYLFGFADPVGQYISLNGTPFLVVGVYANKGSGTSTLVSDDGEYDMDYWLNESINRLDRIILMPSSMTRIFNNNQPIEEYVVKARDTQSTKDALSLINGFLTGLISQQNGYFNVYTEDTWQNQEDEANKLQQRFLGGIAAISLLVGGIGIMNIMLVTVTERTREIGIRKAIGAQRQSIITQFLIEAAMICGIGGIFGILVGYLGTLIVGKLSFGIILIPSATITVGAFLISVVLGIIFGMYPAVKASGLQPVEALRAE